MILKIRSDLDSSCEKQEQTLFNDLRQDITVEKDNYCTLTSLHLVKKGVSKYKVVHLPL